MRRNTIFIILVVIFSSSFSLDFTNHNLRRIKESFDFFPEELYERQFHYRKYKAIDKSIEKINNMWGVEISGINISENSEAISYEKIRGAIYKELKNTGLFSILSQVCGKS
jgi:hypothetical protein